MDKEVFTGGGLERWAAVLQGKRNNYDSDLFAGILARAPQRALHQVEWLAGFRGICFALLDGGDTDQYGSMGIEGHSFSARIGSRGPPRSGA